MKDKVEGSIKRLTDLLSAKKLFDWFTEEVVYSNRIYSSNRLATKRLNSEIKKMEGKLGVKCTLRRPFDARVVKKEKGIRKVLLILEYENVAGWTEVERTSLNSSIQNH